jgi:hypothetical protein
MDHKLDKVQLADFVVKRHDVLKSKRAVWDSLWQELGEYCMPRKAEIQTSNLSPTTQREDVLFDNTMVYGNMVLANGCMSYLSPADARWFSFDPPAYLKGVDPVEQYFRQGTEIAMAEMASSNFYTECHEMYLDRGCFGTATLFCEPGRRSTLNFSKFDIGTYSIAEDDEGYIDTLSRDFKLTTRQAVQWFGKDNVSEIIRKAFDEGNPQQLEREWDFIHQVFPRQSDEIELDVQGRPMRDAANMPIASVYVERDKKIVCRISGYLEQPFFSTRYLKWYSNHAYGWSPAWVALPEARQLNFLQKQLDALAELTAFPRFLVPDTHEGEVDYRASGVTYYDAANPNAVPREWATGGRYDVGKDRAEQKQKAIEKAFHVDLFQMFANLDRPQMTAREVSERSAEKLVQFSPTFARLTTEFFTPLLRRVWAILTRAGRMPPPPQELLQQTQGGGVVVPLPNLVYSSKIALAIKSLENVSLGHTFETWLPVVQMKPEVMDNLNWDETFRDNVRNGGLPKRWLLEMDQVADIRKQRAQQMEEMKQQQQGAQMADSVGKVGAIKQDSMVGQMLANAQGGGPNGKKPARL